MDNVSLLQIIVKQCIKERLTPLIWGKHGVGKSQIIAKIGSDLGFEVIDLRLGQLEVGDLVGMPDREYFCPFCKTKYGLGGNITHCPICKKNEGVEIPIVGRTIWLPPSWFPQNGEKRLIFFDEINRGRLDVQQATFQIVLDYRIHTHVIPKNCAIICAANPPGGDYHVEELDPALLSRFINIKFNLTTKEWLNWARENKIMDEIIEFISTDSKSLGNETVEIPIDVKPNPRSYEFLSKLLRTLPRMSGDRDIWLEVASCIIGEATALQFVQSLKADVEKPIKAEDIFNNFKKVKPKVMVQIKGKEKGENRFDLLRATLDDIIFCLKDGKSKKYTIEQLNNLGDFMVMLPQDLSFSAMQEMAKMGDVNDRLLLKRTDAKGYNDLFEVLKNAKTDTAKKVT